MNKNVWTTPFGLTLLIGSGLALIAGYAYGTNILSVEGNGYNAALGLENFSEASDENLLIEANREPAADAVRASEEPTSSEPIETGDREAEVPVVAPPEPAIPDEPQVETVNESDED